MKKCELCHKEGTYDIDLVNVELDVGFKLGNIAKEMEYPKRVVKPQFICLTSIYLCKDCENKLGKNLYNIQTNKIMRELKEALKDSWLKQLIISALGK